jgi:hypothetical protein
MSRDQNYISDETLLGYLLGSLDDQEQRRIDELSSSDPVLQSRIRDLSDLLRPFQSTPVEFEPRCDLTADTMAFIRNASSRGYAEPDGPHGTLMTMTPMTPQSSREWRVAWLDSLVALAAGIVILTFLLPSVLLTRESSRRMSCAANIRHIGEALQAFAYGNSDHRLPRIDPAGPLSFAGIYAIKLQDAGLLASPKKVWCPSRGYPTLDQPIPTTADYLSALPSTQSNWRYTVGGNYAYNLGHVVDGNYVTPSLGTEYSFAIMGDSLIAIDNEPSDVGPIHGRNAANVLFSDGRIQYVRVDHIDATQMDNPYLNRAFQQAVGHGIEDCCLGPSFQSPLPPFKSE